MEAAKETVRELEEPKKTAENLLKEKAELSSAMDAAKEELAARNTLLTELLEANTALTENNTQLTRDLKGATRVPLLICPNSSERFDSVLCRCSGFPGPASSDASIKTCEG